MAYLASEYLLTIAIPTYNRSGFLKDALNSVKKQFMEVEHLLEVIVSDNCSTDNTYEVVLEFINSGLPIRYIKNNENFGADFNISQCYSEAKGKYILTFGDDDILIEGAISNIFSIINKHPNFGILHLGWCLNTSKSPILSNDIEVQFFDDYEHFLRRINHNITFISGNVINSKYVNQIDLNSYYNSKLIQLPIFLNAVLNSEYNLVLTKPTVAVPLDNSGGYSICTVFGNNIHSILVDFSINEKAIRSFNEIKNSLLVYCFPGWIKRLKMSSHNFAEDDIHKLLYPVYKDHLSYWLFNYILIVQSRKILTFTWPIYRYYSYFLRTIRNLGSKKVKYSSIKL